MRRRASRLVRLLVTLTAVGLLCLGAWIAGVLALGLPMATQDLGPPAAGLDPVQRAAITLYLLANQRALHQPAGDPQAALELEVESGETAGQVIARLQTAGVVRNSLLLRAYLRYHGLDLGVEAGRYRLDGGMTPLQIAQALQTARAPEILLTIPEGWRREQIAEALPADQLDFGAQDFLQMTESHPTGYSFSGQLAAAPNLEGFLFPDTYRLNPDITALELVLTMLDNFERQVGPDLRAGFDRQGLNLLQAVTLASIVEREAVLPEERPTIASVFLNRLGMGMKLDADPTVQYALGRQPDGSWWKAPLSLQDLEIDSPFNTYKYPGLPPGPIANPGLSALQAVALPDQTPYLYFRAACDGSGRHLFATTFEEHLANACP